MKGIKTTTKILLSIIFVITLISPFKNVFAETDIQEQVLSHIGNSLTEVKNGDLEKVRVDLQEIQKLIEGQEKTSALNKKLEEAIKDIDHNDAKAVTNDVKDIALETEKWIQKTSEKKHISQADFNKLIFQLDRVVSNTKESNIIEAKNAYKLFEVQWFKLENDIRKADSGIYGKIESNMIISRSALFSEKPENSKIIDAFTKLIDVLKNPTSGDSKEVSIESAINLIDKTISYLQDNETKKAQDSFALFIEDWPYVEVMVQSNSMDLYKQIENDTTVALSQLTEKPKAEQTLKTITSIQANLQLATKKASYTMFDAGTIVFREGLEALIIISALLAMLTKGKQEFARKWIYLGGVLGVVASLVAGLLFKFLLSKVSAGVSNQLIEGFSGIIAVLFMLTVGLWLHKQSKQQEYGKAMKEKAQAAIASGGIFSLSLLAFFAVFREGAETVVFYIGMSSSISTGELLLGFAGGLIVLFIIGFFLLKGSKLIPLKPFFIVASLCIYYLTFKFIGQSIHSLQAVGYLPNHMSQVTPTIPKIGVYPSLESIVPQILLVIFLAWLFLKDNFKSNNKKKDLTV